MIRLNWKMEESITNERMRGAYREDGGMRRQQKKRKRRMFASS